MYDNILHNSSYGSLLNVVNNYTLDVERKTRQYYGFIIGINNINKFTPLDVFFYGLGSGGSATGGASKISDQFELATEMEVNYAGGTVVPFVTIFDDNGNQIVPEEVHYNYNNKITITFGELLSG